MFAEASTRVAACVHDDEMARPIGGRHRAAIPPGSRAGQPRPPAPRETLFERHGGNVTAGGGLGQGGECLRALRVMVVDDNVDAATMLGMFLESAGHGVFVEHDATRALARSGQEQPDVCLLDIGLPDMDGNELARRLRAQPGGAARMLVAITGYGQQEDRRQSAAAGFDHHFVKPVDADVLLALLAGLKRA